MPWWRAHLTSAVEAESLKQVVIDVFPTVRQRSKPFVTMGEPEQLLPHSILSHLLIPRAQHRPPSLCSPRNRSLDLQRDLYWDLS